MNIREQYAVEVKNRLEILRHGEVRRESTKGSITAAAQCRPKIRTNAKRKRMTEEILFLMDRKKGET